MNGEINTGAYFDKPSIIVNIMNYVININCASVDCIINCTLVNKSVQSLKQLYTVHL